MATQLFLLNTPADTHLGTDNVRLRDGTSGVEWTPKALGTTRGSGVLQTTNDLTITGPTTGLEVVDNSSGYRLEWISPPVAADVTISGTITANVWAAESNMSANVAINVIIEIIRAATTTTRNSNTLVQIVKSTFATELAVTTRAVNNFTAGMTSGGYTAQTLNRGDRLRIRVFGDDAGTMASGFNYNASFNGTTAAADGDTYVTFTENFSFESAPGTAVLDQIATGGDYTIGRVTGGDQSIAQSFTAQTVTLTEVRMSPFKAGAPTDDLIVEIWSDSSGNPNASVGSVATIAGTSLTTSPVVTTWSGLSISLSLGATYWLVLRRSGSLSDTNYYRAVLGFPLPSGWSHIERLNAGVWTSTSSGAFTTRLTFSDGPSTTLYLNNTASDVATASVDREAWTSLGATNNNDIVNTAAGWTAPIQLTDTAGGTVVDWFSKQLQAFTLSGMAVASLRLLESNAAANSSFRCEIARVDADGTNATVWGSWCIAPTGTDNGELTTTMTTRNANVSGDDLAFTNGQRIRIRLYADDSSSAAMATANTLTFNYSPSLAGGAFDSHITLPQTVTEYSAPAAGGPAPRRRRPAHRYTTLR